VAVFSVKKCFCAMPNAHSNEILAELYLSLKPNLGFKKHWGNEKCV
jgi:hypothetical protein